MSFLVSGRPFKVCVIIVPNDSIQAEGPTALQPNTLKVTTTALSDRVFVMRLRAGETLFCCGEVKANLYRIEVGVVGVTWSPPKTGPPELIEVLGPGNILGTGLFEHHIFDAVALVESFVSCWRKDDFLVLAKESPPATIRQAEETEREFLHRRALFTAMCSQEPHQRLAAFLIVASQLNATEGRDPMLIDDTIECGAVAAYLQIDIETLAKALVRLKKLGCIEDCAPQGLHIRDSDLLKTLAAGN